MNLNESEGEKVWK